MAIQKTNLEEYLNRTRIKNKEYFELYLKEFIEELQEGVFKRRIRRDRVLKNINWYFLFLLLCFYLFL